MSETLRDRQRARRIHRGWPEHDDGWDERIADRLNPVLVREVRQASHSRVLSLLLANGGIALFLASIYSLPEPGDPNPASAARGQSMLVLTGLRALMLGYLPFRAFLAMREEVTGEAREQLLLSGLDPLRVVTGRVLSSMLLASVFLGLAGPPLALCAGQRGISIGGMVFALWALGLGSIALSALMSGLAAITRSIEPAAVPVIGALAACFFTGIAQPSPGGAPLNELFEETVRLDAFGPSLATLLAAVATTALGAALAGAALRTGPDASRHGPVILLSIAASVAPLLALAGHAWPEAPWRLDAVAIPAGALSMPVVVGATLAVPRMRASTVLLWALLGAASLELGDLLAPTTGRSPFAAATTHALALWLLLLSAGAALARPRPEPGEEPSFDGRGPLRLLAGLSVLAGAPMLVNGLLGRTSTTWHAGQALNPLALFPHATSGGADAITWAVLGTVVTATWVVALLLAPRPTTADEPPELEVAA